MTRSRSQSLVGSTGSQVATSNGAPAGTWTMPMYSFTKAMTDEVTPNFTDRRAAGAIIMNPCNILKTIIDRSGGGSYYATRPGVISAMSGGGSLTDTYRQTGRWTRLSSDINLSAASTEAMQRALAGIDATPTAFAEDIATIGQTVQFLRRPFKSIYDLSRDFAASVRGRRRKSRASYRAKAIADAWLEYRFAFKPLVMSAQALMEELQSPTPPYPVRRKSSGIGNAEYAKTDTQVSSGFSTKRTLKHQAKVRALVIYEVTNPAGDWRSRFGLRNKDIPRLLWDLFPYSFMLDRVSDIGSTISGAINILDPSIVIVGACTSVTGKLDETYSLVSQVASGWTVSISPDVDRYKTESYVRSKWTPSFSNTLPGFNLRGLVEDITKITDLTALIVSAHRRL